MFQRLYILKFSFLLSMIQSAVVVYLSVIGINDGEFYNKLFYYSLFLSIVPIVFAIIIFSVSSQLNSYIDEPNVFVNKNMTNTHIEKQKSFLLYGTSVYLVVLGLIFLLYNLIFRLLSLPYWIIFVLPIFLSIGILYDEKKQIAF